MTSDTIEKALLGSMLISPDAIVQAFDADVKAEHFYRIAHQHIYRAIESLADRAMPVDTVTLADRLTESSLLDDVGGVVYVQELFNVMPTAANTPHYIQRLKAIHAKRTRAANVERAATLLKEGHTEMAAHVLAIVPPEASIPSVDRTLKFEDFWQVKVDTAKRPLVDEVLGHSETGVIYGPSGAGKSFFASDLAFHVAMGWPWYGRTVSQGGVLYVAAEAAGSMRLRFLALATHYKHLKGRPVPLRLVPESVNFLLGDDDVRALIDLAKQPIDGVPVHLIILDTLAALIPGGDENDFQSMSTLTARLDLIKRETSATVIVIHHSGKDTARGARGHSSLKGNVDFMIELSREEDTRMAVIEKVRDGEDGKRFGFQLVPIEVGTRFDGAPKMVPIVVHLSSEQTRKPPEGRNRDALQLLVTLLEASPNGVSLELWRSRFVSEMSGQLSAKASRDAHHRAVRQLNPWVSVTGGIVTLRCETRVIPERQAGVTHNNVAMTLGDAPLDAKIASSLKTAPGAAAPATSTERQDHLKLCPTGPSVKASPTLRGDAVDADAEEAEARARIESLRPKTKKESDDAFAAMLDDIEKK